MAYGGVGFMLSGEKMIQELGFFLILLQAVDADNIIPVFSGMLILRDMVVKVCLILYLLHLHI